ncbi:MAG: GvpL/GvpF family gas vesicle protein [Chloroflexi bacterium]|nr:GvpL/GvpF family gas vesicle protein [Chloroflexota bacterium]
MGLETPPLADTWAEAATGKEGRYIYCIADGGERTSLGQIGIQGDEVYTIPYGGICALVQNCPAQPYQSKDPDTVKSWVLTHQKVVDAAWERWETVLPLSFDTIIMGEGEGGAEGKVLDWLKAEHEGFKVKIERLRGKAEYGVQVFWQPKAMAQNLVETSPEVRRLDEIIRAKPRGAAYLYRRQLESLIRGELETKAGEYFRDLYHRIKTHVEDIRIEKTKEAESGWQMIMNLSCLVCRDKYQELGEELDRLDDRDGLSVRFTGPWPPYSFVGTI